MALWCDIFHAGAFIQRRVVLWLGRRVIWEYGVCTIARRNWPTRLMVWLGRSGST
jgi:hypothetical protein